MGLKTNSPPPPPVSHRLHVPCKCGTQWLQFLLYGDNKKIKDKMPTLGHTLARRYHSDPLSLLHAVPITPTTTHLCKSVYLAPLTYQITLSYHCQSVRQLPRPVRDEQLVS